MARVRWHYKACIICLISGIFLVWFGTTFMKISTTTRTQAKNFLDPKAKLIQPPDTCKSRNLKISDKPLPSIVIASFPESGAEWIQDLLEKITGFPTVNTLCRGKTNNVFDECPKHQYALTMRTHEVMDTTNMYQKAVIIIRSPYTAITTVFNEWLKKLGQRNQARAMQYRKKFTSFMWQNGDKWIEMYESWLNFTGEKKVIFYEELYSNPAETVKIILRLANIKKGDIKLNCFDEVSWKPVNQPIVKQQQLTMFTIDFRKKIEIKIRDFENSIAKIRNETHQLLRHI